MKAYNSDKIYKYFQTIVFIVIIIYAFIRYGLPEFKNNFGSSDNFINTEKYNSIIELKLSSGPNFALITDKEENISNILFFNNESLCLYNQNIENKTYKEALKKITEILNSKDYLTEGTIVEFTEYPDNKDYLTIRKEFTSTTNTLNLSYIESVKTLPTRAKELSLDNTENSLSILEDYSKQIISNYKESQIITNLKDNNSITKENASKYADNIYKKLEDYATNVTFQEIADTKLPIQLIPANEENNIYPSEKSWYYISEHKIYAYIEFKSNDYKYSFCYNGNINNRKEGACQ